MPHISKNKVKASLRSSSLESDDYKTLISIANSTQKGDVTSTLIWTYLTPLNQRTRSSTHKVHCGWFLSQIWSRAHAHELSWNASTSATEPGLIFRFHDIVPVKFLSYMVRKILHKLRIIHWLNVIMYLKVSEIRT